MVDTLIILSLLNIVSYCEGQLPINGRFTDRFGKSVDDQFRILTGETTRRILNQFQTRATVKDQTHILDSRLNNMGSDLVPTDAQSLFSFIQSELGRLGISNTDFNSNLQSGVFTGKNLGNFGSTDFLQGQNEVTPVWGNIKHVSVPSTIEPQVSNKERLRNKIIDFNTGGHRHTIVNGWSGNKSDHDQLFERENNQSSQEKRTIYNSEGQVQLPFNFNLNTVSQGNIGERALSEADLLQMGTDELAAVAKNKIDFNSEQSSHSNLPSGLGKHAMSLNSIVDVNMHQPPSDLYTSNSSTEERLILALLERLVELKENRLQRQSAVLRNENDISSRLAPIRDESISSRGSTVVSPGWHGSVQSSFCHYR